MPAAIFLTPGAEPSGRFGRGIVILVLQHNDFTSLFGRKNPASS
ncbi:MAG: hypothetical protein O3A19_12190 [Planctomycetota bacterium]|nr:hypothetical protein [Planctomycetota bacterium]